MQSETQVEFDVPRKFREGDGMLRSDESPAAPSLNAKLEIRPPRTVTRLAVQGMTCHNCARHVTEALQGVNGVLAAHVDLPGKQAEVRWNPALLPDVDALLQAVQAAGFSADLLIGEPSPATARQSWSPLAGWKFNVLVGALALIPLMMGDWILQQGTAPWFHWTAFALALPVQLCCGARFYLGAWGQLKAGRSNMDTLVALGSTTAFFYSVTRLFRGEPGHLYFMESTAIITLISLGHWLESRTSAKAADALKHLLQLAPTTARVVESNGREIAVPVDSLQLNQHVILRPGDAVPTDGLVLEGQSAVDESMLTGESLPAEKFPGAPLYAGTANQNGRLIMRVTATGEATALARIIATVQRAQDSRASIQRLGDRVSSLFVPLVVLVALATGLGWAIVPDSLRQFQSSLAPYLWTAHLPATPLATAVLCAVGVLIVACPCAMGLATPVAIMAGTNAAARRGILIRDGAALEQCGHIQAVLFDKTGTLTQGNLSITDTFDPADVPPRGMDLNVLIAALARSSHHPVSQGLARHYAETAPSANLSACQEHRGLGISATLPPAPSAQGRTTVRLGSLAWLKENGVDLTPAQARADAWSAQGATLVGLAVENRLQRLVALRDTLKPHVAEVIERLAAAGKSVYLVTGDRTVIAHALAQNLGIPADHVFAEVRPEQKNAIVQRLQQGGQRVAFIGDGINDAPALEQADLGIAVSRATDIARESAHIVLLKSDIHAIPEALGLAQATLRVIKQNLFWAFFYNIAAVPLAALGFLSPILCAAAMGFSDLMVIGNALRLRRWKLSPRLFPRGTSTLARWGEDCLSPPGIGPPHSHGSAG
jgi:P-type Cu+ transporter